MADDTRMAAGGRENERPPEQAAFLIKKYYTSSQPPGEPAFGCRSSVPPLPDALPRYNDCEFGFRVAGVRHNRRQPGRRRFQRCNKKFKDRT